MVITSNLHKMINQPLKSSKIKTQLIASLELEIRTTNRKLVPVKKFHQLKMTQLLTVTITPI